MQEAQFPIPLLVVVGPTASGKSSAAITLAQRFDAEILSVDSLQVYQHLTIGTGKLLPHEQEGIPHHLLDVIDPRTEYNAAQFQRDADQIAQEVAQRNKRLILAGGTGLYLRALLHGLFDTPSDPQLRSSLREEVQTHGLPLLYQRLQQHDPDAAQKISPNDQVRIVRALEVFALTGQPFSKLANAHQHQEQRYPALLIGINPPRPTLYEQINQRVLAMLRQGWSAEVQYLRDLGYGPELKPMQCIGYRELNSMLDGTFDPQLLPARIQKQTRSYAKRQLTWFRKEPVQWFESPQALLQSTQLDQTINHFFQTGHTGHISLRG